MPGFDLITSIREIEAARDDIVHPSFVGTLFDGQPNFELVFPFPRQAEADKRRGDAVCANVAQFLHDHVDPDAIERTGNIPRDVLDGLAQLGCFGLKIPKEYGGLGLSLTNYNRVLQLVASVSPALGSDPLSPSVRRRRPSPHPVRLRRATPVGICRCWPRVRSRPLPSPSRRPAPIRPT